jgi:predicted MFS family arabinose efflux permease
VRVDRSLVLGSALAGWVVTDRGYRGTFGVLAGVGVAATLVVLLLVPEARPITARRTES